MRFLLSLLFIFSAVAEAQPLCESLVSPELYRFGQHITHEADLYAHSRKPEAGSLEDRHPGVVKKIVTVMYGTLPYVRWNFASPMTRKDAEEYYRKFDAVEDAVLQISKEMNLSGADDRLFSVMTADIHKARTHLMKDVSAFSPTSEHLNRLEVISSTIQSCLQELIVASLLAGDEFFFHQKIIDHYDGGLPKGFRRHIKRIREQLNPHNVEIDIIVKRKGQRDLWVEVKNNMVPWTLADYQDWCKANDCTSELDMAHLEELTQKRREKYFLQGLIAQAKIQIESRDFINRRDGANILFVTKHIPTVETLTTLKDMGISSWPIFMDPQPFREDLFRSLK